MGFQGAGFSSLYLLLLKKKERKDRAFTPHRLKPTVRDGVFPCPQRIEGQFFASRRVECEDLALTDEAHTGILQAFLAV